MRIVCPNCHAAYEVPESLVTGGKAVRCARCGTEWTPAAEAPPPPEAAPRPAPPEPPPPGHAPEPEHATEPEHAPEPEPLPEPSPIAVPPPPEPMAPPGLRAEPRLPGYRSRNVDTEDDARPPPRDDEIAEPRRSHGALIAWVVSLLVLALLIWAVFAFRGHVMGAWPPSTRLYATLGLR